LEGYLSMGASHGSKKKIMEHLEVANQIATEAISNAKTVAMLGKEAMFLSKYCEASEEPYREGVRLSLRISFGTAIGQAVTFLVNAAMFYVGGVLVAQGTYTSLGLLATYFALQFSASFSGQSTFFFTTIAKGRVAVQSIFTIVNRQSRIDSRSHNGMSPEPRGDFEAQEVSFSYPSRNKAKVLQDVRIRGSKGQMIAIVGPSGSGKSTIVALIERFYDVTGGALFAEGVDVREWKLSALREELALVGQ
ncbi:(ABC) transporter, partial [Gonapodya sp. JEL0774]